MTFKSAPAVFNCQKNYTYLGVGVWNICRVTVAGELLQPVRSRWEFPPDEVIGKPTMWAEHGERLYLYPTPDRAYVGKIDWTGSNERPPVLSTLNDRLSDDFMRLYHQELKRAKECA